MQASCCRVQETWVGLAGVKDPSIVHTLLPRTEYVPSRSSSSSWGAEVSDAAKSAYAWGRFTIGWAAVRASSLLDGKK